MKDGTLAHLLPAARKQAELGNDERILGLLCDRWIDYPRATQALQQLQRLFETPRRDRMPCLLLHGDSNIGKTKITAKFRRAHPNEFDERRGVERCPVVAMQMPSTPDQHRFYSGLLFELGAPHNAAAGLASLERLARDILKRVSPRMLVVDEVHHLLAGTYREQRASLNLLKFLANDLQISMVLVGTRDAVLALQTDTQMISRYTPFEIPRWRESDGLRRLLAAFERVLPLRKPSDLARREIVQFVLSATGGLTGEISTLLSNAAELSIRTGDEYIGITYLEHVGRVAK
ncbi:MULTISPECIES: TniB family NTP-binding protein [Paraburkholderia]|uniref:TniB family NTP-binding protein n=1 Tax=Paraburkholderia madseniana TaxID=2599607 RepID=A0AAP5EN10_9BURK|nr:MULTISPECIES: TniB family NTP-binding protein [Paraburkholderia]MCX4145219.1 TniB family NTP-binding protein [Paraburkholderia madseniana]MDN7148169.1 TniB family NTP-binding protein [Paraburkholderia sp. WS6]MDQ6407049.1 TniB family NTP-binding protein [Paraburkholderia madseniana]